MKYQRSDNLDNYLILIDEILTYTFHSPIDMRSKPIKNRTAAHSWGRWSCFSFSKHQVQKEW